MKKFLRFFSVLAFTLSLVTVVSCAKDDDPVDNDLFAGEYKGSVSYSNADQLIKKDDGSVTVLKTGDTYSFIFSDNIPNLTGIKLDKNKNVAIMIGSTEASYIRIDEDVLKISYIKDKALWTANCKR